MTAQDTHKPKGKYTVLTTIAEKYTTNPGHPGNSTPVMDEIYNTFLIPQMFAEVAQGKSTPAEAVSAFARKAQGIYAQVEGPEARLARTVPVRPRAPATGPSRRTPKCSSVCSKPSNRRWPRSCVSRRCGRAGARRRRRPRRTSRRPGSEIPGEAASAQPFVPRTTARTRSTPAGISSAARDRRSSTPRRTLRQPKRSRS